MIELGWVLLWYLASIALGLIAFPIVFFALPSLPDRGYALCRVAAFAGAGFVIWALSFLGIPVRTSWWVALVGLAVVSAYLVYRNEQLFADFFRERKKLLLALELLFFAAFLGFCVVRSLSPSISGGEKFMDFSIFNAAQRAEHLPLLDPWISDQPLRYYWFGHLFLGQFSRTLGTPSQLGYNLAIALLFALAVLAIAGLGVAFKLRWPWIALGVGFAGVFGNLAGAVHIVNKSWQEFNFWTPTRVIDGSISGTINEFPFFSFWFADLHAHVIAFSMVLALFAVYYQLFQTGWNKKTGALAILLLACIRVTNAWDWPALVATLGLVLAARWWRSPRHAPWFKDKAFLSTVLVPWLAITVLSFALFLTFPQPQPLSIKLANIHSTTGEWLAVFGGLLIPVLAFILVQFKDKTAWVIAALAAALALLPIGMFVALVGCLLLFLFLASEPDGETAFSLVFAFAACCILVGIELIYVNDWLARSWQRMNTMFKFGLHSWLLLSVAVPVLAERAWRKITHKFLFQCLGSVLILALLVYPVVVIAQQVSRNPAHTLDGWHELQRIHYGDWRGASWFAHMPGNPVVLEAAGDAYTYASRISAHTGLPTVVGWQGHLFQHGVPWDEIFRRKDAVNLIYNSTLIADALPALDLYNVSYVYIGEVERQRYAPQGLTKFSALPKAFEDKDVVVYRVA